MQKIQEWLNRYFIPTLLSIVCSVGLALSLNLVFNKPLITALGGTWGDNIGFYGLIFYKDIKERRKKDKKITFIGLLKIIRNGITEFGVAEYLDSFLIRPGLMLLFPKLLDNTSFGILLAKLAADVTFFAPTIVFYEIRKRIFKD